MHSSDVYEHVSPAGQKSILKNIQYSFVSWHVPSSSFQLNGGTHDRRLSSGAPVIFGREMRGYLHQFFASGLNRPQYPSVSVPYHFNEFVPTPLSSHTPNWTHLPLRSVNRSGHTHLPEGDWVNLRLLQHFAEGLERSNGFLQLLFVPRAVDASSFVKFKGI